MHMGLLDFFRKRDSSQNAPKEQRTSTEIKEVVSQPSIPESDMGMQYGQTRTLVDIIKTLNKEHHYHSYEELKKDFSDTIRHYRVRGTIPSDTFYIICSSLEENKAKLFDKNQLNIARLEKIVCDKKNIKDKLERIYHKRATAKLLRIIQYINNFREYTTAEELISDLQILRSECLRNSILNDDRVPVFHLEDGLHFGWQKIAPNGLLDNSLLEQYVFEHDDKVKEEGLNAVIDSDYEQNDPCHAQVYTHHEPGRGPVYIKNVNGTFSRSCGTGPISIPYFYESRLLKTILENDKEYIFLKGYFLPKTDFAKPIFNTYECLFIKEEQKKMQIFKSLHHSIKPCR